MNHVIRALLFSLCATCTSCGCQRTDTADTPSDSDSSSDADTVDAGAGSDSPTDKEADTQSDTNSDTENDTDTSVLVDTDSDSERDSAEDTGSGKESDNDSLEETDPTFDTDSDSHLDTEVVQTDSETVRSSDPLNGSDFETGSTIETDTDLDTRSDDDSDTSGAVKDDTDTASEDTVPLDPCIDIDCLGRGHCIVDGDGPKCVCDEGFAADELACRDIDECESGLNDCGGDEHCVNFEGSFRCYESECKPSPLNYLAGYPLDIQRLGNLLFVASGPIGVRVFEISDNEHLTMIKEFPTQAKAALIRIHEGIAYVYGSISNIHLLEIFDVADPQNPIPLATERLPWSVRAMEIQDGELVILDPKLNVYDIADPENPILVSGLILSQSVEDIAIADGFVYGASKEGWMIADVRDPEKVALVSEYFYPDAVNDYDAKASVAVDKDAVYLNMSRYVDNAYVGALNVYDTSIPESPILLGTTVLSGPIQNISLKGDHALLTAALGGLEVVDISDRSNMIVTKEISGTQPIFAACDDEDSICAARSGNNLYLLDVSNEAEPLVEATPAFPYDPGYAAVYGTLALVAEDNTLFLIDVSDPAALSTVRQIQFSQPILDSALEGDTLYIGVYGEGIWSLDLTAPYDADPSKVDGLAAYITDVSTFDGLLFALEEHYESGVGTTRRLHVIDIGDAATPAYQGAVDIPGSVNDLLAVGPYAFLQSYYGTALYIVDATDKAAPVLCDPYTLPEYTFAGSVFGYDAPYLYVGLVDSLTAILDVSNPAEPLELGTIVLHGRPRSFSFDEADMYVVDSLNLLLRMDNSDRLHPKYSGRYEVFENAKSALESDGMLYVLSAGGGLQVIDAKSPPKQDMLSEMLSGLYTAAPHVDADTLYLAQVNPLDYKDASSVVRRYDLGDGDAPVLTGSYTTDDGRVMRIETQGDYAYIAQSNNPSSSSYNSGRIDVLDASSPSHLSFVESKGYRYAVFDVQMNDSFGAAVTQYVRAGNTRIWATLAGFEVDGFAPAELTNEIELESRNLVEAALDGSTVWMADGTSSLAAWDLQGESPPLLIASHDIGEAASNIAVDDQNRAFVSTLSKIRVFDVADPNAPVSLGEFDTGGFPAELVVRGQVIYVEGFFNGKSSIKVFDIGDLSAPSVVNTLDFVGNGFNVTKDGIIVATGGYGAQLYDPFVCYAN